MQPTSSADKPFSGFFRLLYDFSFDEFITPKIIRVVYILALVVAALWSTGFLLSGFGTLSMISQIQGFGVSPNSSPLMTFALVQILGAPVLFVLLSVVARVYLEFAMAVFRIAENTDAMRRRD